MLMAERAQQIAETEREREHRQGRAVHIIMFILVIKVCYNLVTMIMLGSDQLRLSYTKRSEVPKKYPRVPL